MALTGSRRTFNGDIFAAFFANRGKDLSLFTVQRNRSLKDQLVAYFFVIPFILNFSIK